MASIRRLSTGRITGDSATDSGQCAVVHRRAAVRARTPSRVPAVAEAGCAPTSASAAGNKGKPVPLEEPYVIQPTAAVFHKLYNLLVRSLAQIRTEKELSKAAAVPDTAGHARCVPRGAAGSAGSRVLSLLQIMRANFCRLVDAHVDPAEVGLLLGSDRECHKPNDCVGTDGQNGSESLLPNILRCLQGIMLEGNSEPVLLRATVDTISSGLPLLVPQVQDRLRLLLALVRHLQGPRGGDDKMDTRMVANDSKHSVARVAKGLDGMKGSGIPRERVMLLRDLLGHFARTESVVQLLTLFEENEAERNAVSSLLELMLTSMADKACLGSGTAATHALATDGNGTEYEGLSHAGHAQDTADPTHRTSAGCDAHIGAVDRSGFAYCGSHWEQLVASGAGGTTLDFTLLETCQQHLLCMVLDRDRMQENPQELLLCQYGQCLIRVRFVSAPCPREGILL